MRKILLAAAFGLSALCAQAQEIHTLDINLKKTGAPIQNTMYGIFFEDINYAADGGLYAELVKNRSFEFPCDGQLDMDNSLDAPALFQPAAFSFHGEGKCLSATAPAYSFSVFILEK